MRRFFMALAVFGLVGALVAPCWAATLSVTSWLGTKTAVNKKGLSAAVYPTKDSPTLRYTHMRGRIRFQFDANENVGMVSQHEMDFNFGDYAYSDGRNKGGGLGADNTNLETKQLYMHINIPDTPLSLRIGQDWVSDEFDMAVLGNDTAGFQGKFDTGDTLVRAGYFRFWDETSNSIVDDTDFYMLSLTQKLNPTTSVGGAFYYLKDGSGYNGHGELSSARPKGNGAIASAHNPGTGYQPILADGTIYSMNAYWLGAFGNTLLGPVTLNAWFVYSFGTVDIENPGQDDIDISGFAAKLGAGMKVQNINVEGDFLYVSGKDKNNTEDFGYVSSGIESGGSNPYSKGGMMILMNDANDFHHAEAFVYDISNIHEDRFLGTTALTLKASMPLPYKLTAKAAAGAVWSSEKRKVNDNSYMGTELNGTLEYTIAPGATVALLGAYAWTGNFYEVSATEASNFNASGKAKGTVNPNTDPDDIYYTYLRFMVRM